ncbi:MAG: DUF6600 domain-containing protein, partial [Desulfobaccales bacterium]
LSAYGTWVDYGNYGPVWYPTKGVTQNWRPYVDGRWVPTDDGWVFETGEPWGWATYHWGNWMPTSEYGWVWSPGSTWYPSTAAWRTSDDYVGWAPIPPADYVPEPAYAPAAGYYPGEPVTDLLSAPFWIFAQAANFLLGFGQPYLPAYSYYNTGYLAPYDYVPFLFASSLFLSDFYYPAFANNAFYCYGPSFPYISRVTNVNINNINNYARSANFRHIRGGLPSSTVMGRHPWIRDAIPGSVRENGRFQAQRVANPATAGRRLAQSGAMRAPGNVPSLSHEIPRGVTPQAQPAVRRGAAGVAGPRGATPGVSGARGAAPTGVGVAPRGPSAPRGVTAPGGEHPATTGAPAHELRTPTRAPAGEFRAPVREQAPAARATRAPAGEFRAPSRATTMPPPSTHELTPQMHQQIRQYQRAPSSVRPSAPAPSFRAPAAAPRMAPSAPRMSAPAPRPSAPAAAPHPSAPSGGGAPPHK